MNEWLGKELMDGDKTHLEDRKTAPFIYQFPTQAKAKIRYPVPLLFPGEWLESPTRHHDAIPSLAYAPEIVPDWYWSTNEKIAEWTINEPVRDSSIIVCMKN